jgi:hypothetical protein
LILQSRVDLSFLIANGDVTLVDIAKQLLASGPAAKNDWGRPMAYLRQFGSNFFARAGAEIRATFDSMLAEARSKGEQPSDFLKWTEVRYGHIPDFKMQKSIYAAIGRFVAQPGRNRQCPR